MRELIQQILSAFVRHEDLVLATIIDHKGSTPRDTGTRCLIKQNGDIVGTIGGGLVEAKTMKAAENLFKTKGAVLLEYDMTQHYSGTDTMICGGKMAILVEYLKADPQNNRFFQALLELYQRRESSLFVVELKPSNQKSLILCHGIVNSNNQIEGDLNCDQTTLESIRTIVEDKQKACRISLNQREFWVEPQHFPKKCFLFGAGHVSGATAPLAQKSGFQTIVIDDRQELLSRKTFREGIELITVDKFAGCFEQLAIDQDSFIVILTRGHSHDKLVLAQALQSKACYVGMIGSRRKRNTIYGVLREEGVSQQELDQVHSPIGLDIGAETPAEIAISIIGELIKIRAGK